MPRGLTGAGKTTLALQFLLEGVKSGERSLYVTLSDTRDELEDIARSHGWSLDGLSLLEVSSQEAQEETETTTRDEVDQERDGRAGERRQERSGIGDASNGRDRRRVERLADAREPEPAPVGDHLRATNAMSSLACGGWTSK